MLSLLRPRTPLGGVQLVPPLERDPRDSLDDVDELVDRHELGRAEVDRVGDLRFDQPKDAIDRVVDVREASRLFAVAPDLDRVRAVELGLDHLATDRRRRLLATPVVRAVRPIDVVEAGHAD